VIGFQQICYSLVQQSNLGTWNIGQEFFYKIPQNIASRCTQIHLLHPKYAVVSIQRNAQEVFDTLSKIPGQLGVDTIRAGTILPEIWHYYDDLKSLVRDRVSSVEHWRVGEEVPCPLDDKLPVPSLPPCAMLDEQSISVVSTTMPLMDIESMSSMQTVALVATVAAVSCAAFCLWRKTHSII